MRMRLSPTASITPTKGAVILRSDLGTFSIDGPDLRAFLDNIVPLLDGSRDRPAIFEALSGYSPKSVGAFLDLLTQRGLLEESAGDEDRFAGQDAFLQKCGAKASMRSVRVAVFGEGARPTAMLLAQAGLGALDLVGTRDQGDIQRRFPWCEVDEVTLETVAIRPPDLLVVKLEASEAHDIERLSHLAHAAGLRSLWASTAMLGPLVIPGRTACRVCAMEGALGPPSPARADDDVVDARLALEAIKAVTRYASSWLAGRVSREDEATFETRLHTLVRIPWCRVCGKRAR